MVEQTTAVAHSLSRETTQLTGLSRFQTNAAEVSTPAERKSASRMAISDAVIEGAVLRYDPELNREFERSGPEVKNEAAKLAMKIIAASGKQPAPPPVVEVIPPPPPIPVPPPPPRP